MLNLYTTPLSANGRKVLAVSRQLGVSCNVHLVDVYKGEGRTPSYLAINPSGKIPTIVDGNSFFRVKRNPVVPDQAYGGYALSSSDPQARSRVRNGFSGSRRIGNRACLPYCRSWSRTGCFPKDVSPSLGSDWSNGTVQPLLNTLEAVLAAQPFLTGSKMTLSPIFRWPA